MSQVEKISNNRMQNTPNPLTSELEDAPGVREVPIDSDLAIIEPVVDTIEIDRDTIFLSLLDFRK